MMKQLKKVLVLLLSVFFIFGAFACTNKDDKPTGEAILKIWTVGGPLHYMHNDPNDKDSNTTNYILDSFKKLYPNTKIILEGKGWGTDLNKALREAYIANKMPDIVCGELFIQSQIDIGYYAPLTIPNELKDNIDSVYWKQVTGKDGKIYGMPMFTGCSALIYNENLLKNAGLVNGDGSVKIPQTMNELKDAAAQVYSRSKGTVGGFLMNAVPGIGSAYRNVQIMQMFGGGFYDKNGQLIINSAESKQAMSYLQSLAAYQIQGNTAITEEAQINKLFLDNKVAFAIESGPLTYAAKGIDTKHLKVAPLPAVEGKPSTNMLVGSVSYMISKNSKNKELAQKFLENMLSIDIQKKIYLQSSNRLPVRRDLVMDLLTSTEPDVLEVNKQMKPYIESLFNADEIVAGLPSFGNNYSKIWQGWTSTIQEILAKNGDVARTLDEFAALVKTNT